MRQQHKLKAGKKASMMWLDEQKAYEIVGIYLPRALRWATMRDSRRSHAAHQPMRKWAPFHYSAAWFRRESSVRFRLRFRYQSSNRNCLKVWHFSMMQSNINLSFNSLFCGDPFLSHESIGGFIEYSSSSTSGVAVGTELPVIDDAVGVGVARFACDVAGWPEPISGLSDPPDIAESVSSFSSLRRQTFFSI